MQAIDSKPNPATAGGDNAPRPHQPGQYIRSVLRARDWSRAQGHERVAGRASRGDRLGRRRAVPPGPQANRARWAAGRVGVALRAAQAIPAAELPGTDLSDSASFRAFARLPLHWCPKKSVLQETISAISARIWERINRCLLASASETKVETGTLLRLDSTVTETMIHEPSDSWLLCDAMRIMVRLLDAAGDLPQAPAIAWHNHSRRAKRRAQAIDHCRKQTKRTMLYRGPDRRRRLDRGLSACRRGQGERRRVCRHRGRGLACLGGLLAPLGRAGYRADRAARPQG